MRGDVNVLDCRIRPEARGVGDRGPVKVLGDGGRLFRMRELVSLRTWPCGRTLAFETHVNIMSSPTCAPEA